MIKLSGYLGGHCPNIGSSKVTPLIGAVGQNWTKFGIRNTCLTFKKVFLVHCPIRSGETDSERRRSGGKSRRPIRAGRTSGFDYLQPRDTNSIPPVHVRFFQVTTVYPTYFYSILLSLP